MSDKVAATKVKTGLKHRDVAKDHFSSGKSQNVPNFSRLVITFIEGKSLLASDVETGKSDPVCFVWCGPADETPDLNTTDDENSGILKTKVCPTTTDPIWNEDVVFPLDFNDINVLSSLKCLIYVRDEDISENNEYSYDELGMLEIFFKDIISKGKSLKTGIVLSAAWYTLKKSPGMRKVDGKIKLTINLVIHQNDLVSLSTQLGVENREGMAQTGLIKAFQNVYKSTDSMDSRAESPGPNLRASVGQLPRPSSVSPTRSNSASRQSLDGSLNSSRPSSARDSRGKKSITTAPLVKAGGAQRRPSTAPLISSIPENSTSAMQTPSNRYASQNEDEVGDEMEIMEDLQASRDNEDDVNMETLTKNNSGSALSKPQQPKLLPRPAFKNIHHPDSDEENENNNNEQQNDEEEEELHVIPNPKNNDDGAGEDFGFEVQGGDEGVMEEVVKIGLKAATHVAKHAAKELKPQMQSLVSNVAGAAGSVAGAAVKKLSDAKGVTNIARQSIGNNSTVRDALQELSKTVGSLNVPQIDFSELQKTAPAVLKNAYNDSGKLFGQAVNQGGEMLQNIAKTAGVGKQADKTVDALKVANQKSQLGLLSTTNIATSGLGVAIGAKLNEEESKKAKETKRKSVEKTLIPPKTNENDENDEGSEQENESPQVRTVVPTMTAAVAPNKTTKDADANSARSSTKVTAENATAPKQPEKPTNIAVSNSKDTSPRIAAATIKSAEQASGKPLKPAAILENKLDKMLSAGPTGGDQGAIEDDNDQNDDENTRSQFAVGSQVEVTNPETGDSANGVISEINNDNTVNIDFADGATGTEVPIEIVRLARFQGTVSTVKNIAKFASKIKSKQAKKATNEEQDEDRNADEITRAHFTVGTQVEVLSLKAGGGWSPGVISVVNDDNTYSVDYADGTTGEQVPIALMALAPSTQQSNNFRGTVNAMKNINKLAASVKSKNAKKAENLLLAGPSRGDQGANDDDDVEELQKDNNNDDNQMSLTLTKPNSPPTSTQGTSTAVVRALKEMSQQRIEMERSIQELTRITQKGLQSLSDRISKIEQAQNNNNNNALSLFDGPQGGDEALPDEPEQQQDTKQSQRQNKKTPSPAGNKYRDMMTKSSAATDGAKSGVKGKVSAVAAFKRDKQKQLNSNRESTSNYTSTFGTAAADREPHSKSPSRSSSAAKFEPEIALVYRGTDGRIATNRVQSPPKLGHDKYDTSYEAYQNVNSSNNNRPTSPQRLTNSYDNNNYQQQQYNGYQPQPPFSGSANQLRNSYQQQQQFGNQQNPGYDQKSTVNRDFCDVLDRGSLEDIAQLMECTGPKPELLSVSTRNRLYDAVATLLYQNKHTERCLIWVLALVRGKENLLATMVNHSKKDLLEALEKLSSEPSKKGLLASLLRSQINKQLSG